MEMYCIYFYCFLHLRQRLPLDGVPPALADIIGRCWAQEYKSRPSNERLLLPILTTVRLW